MTRTYPIRVPVVKGFSSMCPTKVERFYRGDYFMRQRCETPVKRLAKPAWLNRRICGLALSWSAHQLDQSPCVKFAAQAAAGPTTEQVITTTENLATAARSLFGHSCHELSCGTVYLVQS